MKASSFLTLATLLAFPTLAFSENSRFNNFELSGGGVNFKNVGEAYSLDIGYNVNQKLRLRLGYGVINAEREREAGVVNVIENIDQKNARISIDWFPLGSRSGLFLNAGLLQLSDPSTLEVPDANFLENIPLGNVTGTLEARSVAPYVGAGYRYQFKKNRGWFVQAEVGKVLNTKPELSLKSDNPANIPGLNASLQAFADSQNDDLKDTIMAYGILVGYRF